MKKVLKWCGIALLTPILLFVLIVILLYIPPIQNWVAGMVADYASEQTGMDISVQHVSLKFPLDLSIDGFRAIKPNDSIPQQRDTIADVGNLTVSVQLLPLFKGQVEVDELAFRHLKVNTDGLIATTRVKGSLDYLRVESHGIDLDKQTVMVNSADIDKAYVDVALMRDTLPEDTTHTVTKWNIQVQQLNMTDSRFALHLPGDSTLIAAEIPELKAGQAKIDLEKSRFELAELAWHDGALLYDNRFTPASPGLDTNHLELDDIQLEADSACIMAPDIRFNLKSLALKEKSGLQLKQLSGPVIMEGQTLSLPQVNMVTGDSKLTAQLRLDLDAFSQSPDAGSLYAELDGSFGKQDIMRFAGNMPKGMARRWPNHPLHVSGLVRGNLQHAELKGLTLSLPTAFDVKTTGQVEHLDNMNLLTADLDLHARVHDISFVTADAAPSLQLPREIGVDGKVKVAPDNYSADINATHGGGSMKVLAHVNTRNMQYDADIRAQRFPISHFLTSLPLSPLTAHITAKGQGTDPFSKNTSLTASADIDALQYDRYSFNGMKAKAKLQNGHLLADVDSRSDILNGKISVDALMQRQGLDATVSADINKMDLYRLRLTEQPLITSLCAHVDVSSDLKDRYDVRGTVTDLMLRTKERDLRAQQMDMDIYLNRDTTHAVIYTGDLTLTVDAGGGYQRLIKQASSMADALSGMIDERTIDQQLLRERLPEMSMHIEGGTENVVAQMLEREGLEYNSLYLHLTSSPTEGLNGTLSVDSLRKDDIVLDKIDAKILTDDEGFLFSANVKNNAENPTYVFNAQVDGRLIDRGAALNAKIYDSRDSLGVKLGATATAEDDGLALRLSDLSPVIGFKTFNVNKDNYVILTDSGRVQAKLDLIAADGTALQFYTNDDNLDAEQDLTASVHKLNLKPIFQAVPFLPEVEGVLNGDFHLIKEEKQLTISSDMAIRGLKYEGSTLGDVGTELVYMPNDDGTHHIDAVINSGDTKVGSIIGTYNPEGKGSILADFTLDHMPLSLANGFFPEQLFGLKGYADGKMHIQGSTQSPQVDGELYLDSTYVFSSPYGVQLRVADDPIRVVNSHLLFENFQLFAYNDQSLDISGELDFSKMDKPSIDLRMMARDFQLVNAKLNKKSTAYGKCFIDLFATMKGPLEAMMLKGRVKVLGKTNMTYVLRDSPINTDNRLEELVKFVDFADSTQQVIERPPISGLNMDMTLNIDNDARIRCDINQEHSNYIDLTGGGQLRMQYNPVEDLLISGRYTLANGEMKYSLPVIPLHTFNIKDGSFVEFTGDPGNPRLNITATERLRANVNDETSNTRSVEFETGVVITKTLKDMGLQFIIEAPEDMTVNEQLNMMSVEERGKVAVTMLTTGMYLVDGNTKAFSMNGALSSFLQTEINNITGNALRTLDLSLGVDNSTDAAGNSHIDYSFKFARRFWNNRLKVVVGGKVSTGNEMPGQNNTFFSNVTFEYRLSPTSNQYLKLYYDRDTYDYLEGNVGEFGVGYMWRRKLSHLKEIFQFKSEKPSIPSPPKDLKMQRPDSIIKPRQDEKL